MSLIEIVNQNVSCIVNEPVGPPSERNGSFFARALAVRAHGNFLPIHFQPGLILLDCCFGGLTLLVTVEVFPPELGTRQVNKKVAGLWCHFKLRFSKHASRYLIQDLVNLGQKHVDLLR